MQCSYRHNTPCQTQDGKFISTRKKFAQTFTTARTPPGSQSSEMLTNR